LAGIYTHTSGHILGAPMAHYNAMNGSRFTFSHDNTYVPVHGLRGILRNENVIMQFRNLKGTLFGHHKAFNFLYRPTEMEHMGLLKFYSETEFIQMSEARKTTTLVYEYTEEHLYREKEAVIYRKKAKAVPTFPWSFLCSTKSFETSLLHFSPKGAIDYEKKEEYAFHFMLLFVPFRKCEDLLCDGSYQKKFQKLYREGKITDEMRQIAENIQTIHNSLASGIPENTLSAGTCLIETAEYENENDDKDTYDDLMASIGEIFASGSNGEGLKEDTKTCDIKFGNKEVEGSGLSETELDNVIEDSPTDDNTVNSEPKLYPNSRFVSTTNNLNTLALQTTITRSQASDDISNGKKDIINANGTWQSITKWGENDGLDAGQQTAFEVLASTYVLSFYNEAIVETTFSISYDSFVKRKDGLSKLARRKPENDDPLCMFITGPAGAGKCKFTELRVF
jgi:hypothetical protein